ncbi:uncharacterized protein LOC114357088 [Ostrinia furnacalis]|uniref:uncharacterized protein LOC114357088 n=1 Tax=Ostrinia furnacalis TaxID=93504 RepID=UPI00103AD531|nr:uncharacterized protein LOC114357088 [Ostrinia furnacalis]
MSFNNKVVIKTEAISGLGAAIALKFAKEGANVVIVGRNSDKLRNVLENISKVGNKPLVIAADVTKGNDVQRIIDDIVDNFGKIDVLVNNAGCCSHQSRCLGPVKTDIVENMGAGSELQEATSMKFRESAL